MTKLRTESEVVRSCIRLTIEFFDGDTDKASTWLHTKNGLFADMEPMDYIFVKGDRAEKILVNLIEGATP